MNVSISVLTPAFNSERHIARCIESVAHQQFDPVEHIIVDGNSTDRTVALIQEKGKQHQHLRYISESDSGQSQAMNKALKMARGSVVGFLNVDDTYESGVLRRVAALFEDRKALMFAVGNCKVVDPRRRDWFIYRPRSLRFKDFMLGPDLFPVPPNPAAYFYKKEIHDTVGYYDENDHLTMDLDFILRSSNAFPFEHFDEFWGTFWLHEQSKTDRLLQDKTIDKNVDQIYKKHFDKLPLSLQKSILRRKFIYRLIARVKNKVIQLSKKPLRRFEWVQA